MKKILFIATVVKQHIIPFHIPHLEMLKKNGYEVHVAARNDYEDAEKCSIPFCDKFYDLPFERFPLKKDNIKVYIKLKKIIKQTDYDIIHCHTPVGGLIGRLASIESRKKGTKLIYTAHGFHFYKGAPFFNWIVYYPIEKCLSYYTDILITINNEDYMRAKKFGAKTVKYIPGVGIDSEKITNRHFDRKNIRESIGFSNDDFIILSVGELNKNKNHQSIIRSIANLDKEHIKYIICGKGPLENELKSLTKELKLDAQVKFLGFRNDINEVMNEVDLFAFPSLREGLSLSLMEAMSKGLPVVCSNIRGNIDLIKEKKGGYLLKPNDIKGFSKVIDSLATSTSLRKKMGENNIIEVERFSLKKVMKEMKAIYSE